MLRAHRAHRHGGRWAPTDGRVPAPSRPVEVTKKVEGILQPLRWRRPPRICWIMPYERGSTASSHVTGGGGRGEPKRGVRCRGILHSCEGCKPGLPPSKACRQAGQKASSALYQSEGHRSLVMNCGTWEGCSPPGGLGQSCEEPGEQGQPARRHEFDGQWDSLLLHSIELGNRSVWHLQQRIDRWRRGHFGGGGGQHSPAARPASATNRTTSSS